MKISLMTNPDVLIKNVKRQSKRLSKLRGLPLTKSQKIVTWAIYCCHDLKDLVTKVKNQSLHHVQYRLIKIDQRASKEEIDFLESNIEDLLFRLSPLCCDNLDKIAQYMFVLQIFGIKEQPKLREFLGDMGPMKWKFYLPEIADPSAILYDDVKWFECYYRIIAIRVFRPDLSSSLTLAEHQSIEDFSYYSRKNPKIIWDSPDAWNRKLEVYAKAKLLDTEAKFEVPHSNEEESVFDVITLLDNIKELLNTDILNTPEMYPVTHSVNGYDYLVFGYSRNKTMPKEQMDNFSFEYKDEGIEQQVKVLTIDSTPIAMEFLKPITDGCSSEIYIQHVEHLKILLSKLPDAEPANFSEEMFGCLMILRPTNNCELKNYIDNE